jgi:type IV secretory pathway TraG/TraD family ATPase VirD4
VAGGIIVGTSANKYWTIDDDTHVLLIGTTRSGKSRRVIMPTIWHLAKMGESMVICDLKKELQPITKKYLQSKGYNIVTLDFRTPSTGNRWNILNPIIEALKNKDTAQAVQHANDVAHTLSYDAKYRGDPIWPSAKKALGIAGNFSIASIIISLSSGDIGSRLYSARGPSKPSVGFRAIYPCLCSQPKYFLKAACWIAAVLRLSDNNISRSLSLIFLIS